jgi:hypothetical protein
MEGHRVDEHGYRLERNRRPRDCIVGYPDGLVGLGAEGLGVHCSDAPRRACWRFRRRNGGSLQIAGGLAVPFPRRRAPIRCRLSSLCPSWEAWSTPADEV